MIFKFNETSKLTKSMRIAVNDLNLTHFWVVHPGQHLFPVEKNISMLPLHQISKMVL
jgi:hypothetical protein